MSISEDIFFVIGAPVYLKDVWDDLSSNGGKQLYRMSLRTVLQPQPQMAAMLRNPQTFVHTLCTMTHLLSIYCASGCPVDMDIRILQP